MSLLAWSFDPLVLVGVGTAATLYARGWRRSRLPRWRVLCFASGLTIVVVALESPIGTYDQQLFVMHMIEHMLLILGAAPLLLLGAPLVPMLWGLPEQERRGVARLLGPQSYLSQAGTALTSPVVALGIFLTTFAAWHVPFLYDAAQARSVVHYTEHFMFFSAALLFWWPVIHPTGGARRLSRVASVLYFAPPMVVGTLIGALLTFAPRPLYATYAIAPRLTTLSPIEDQQLAGLVMWIPSGLVFAAAVLSQIALALREEDDLESAVSNHQTAVSRHEGQAGQF